MRERKLKHGSIASNDYKANRPFVVQPKINRAITVFVDGAEYYLGEFKNYRKDLFDKFFGTGPVGKVKHKYYKGKNPGQRRLVA